MVGNRVFSGYHVEKLPDWHAETQLVDISTDSNGDGSTVVSLDWSYKNTDSYLVTIDDAFDERDLLSISKDSGTQMTVSVAGSATTSGTVTVLILVQGTQDRPIDFEL